MPKPTKSLLVVAAAVIGALPVLLYASVWAMDTRYMTHAGMSDFRNGIVSHLYEMKLARINDVINEINIKREYQETTPADNVRLDYYRRQRQETLQKISRANGD